MSQYDIKYDVLYKIEAWPKLCTWDQWFPCKKPLCSMGMLGSHGGQKGGLRGGGRMNLGEHLSGHMTGHVTGWRVKKHGIFETTLQQDEKHGRCLVTPQPLGVRPKAGGKSRFFRLKVFIPMCCYPCGSPGTPPRLSPMSGCRPEPPPPTPPSLSYPPPCVPHIPNYSEVIKSCSQLGVFMLKSKENYYNLERNPMNSSNMGDLKKTPSCSRQKRGVAWREDH